MFLDELGVSCTSLLNEMNVFILFNNCFYAHRTSPNCPKSRSTLERTCPGTWPRCTRCVLPIRTSWGRWATGGERSRSEAIQTRRHHATARFNPHFFCAARAEEAAGHHGAPPAEAGSVCHVQQQQVVPHSSSYSHVPILPSGLLQWNAAKRSRSMCYLHHLSTPPTTTIHPVFIRRSHPSPLICHFVPFATRELCNNSSRVQPMAVLVLKSKIKSLHQWLTAVCTTNCILSLQTVFLSLTWVHFILLQSRAKYSDFNRLLFW